MEATPEQAAEGLVIVKVLAAVLDRLVCANAPIAASDPGQVTKFHAMKAPGIGVEKYLERIHKYASCSNECFVLALIYIDRLIQRNNFLLSELNVHRVCVTAVLLAAKFFDDAYYNNAYYAKVGGVLVSEMNGLEVDFLFRINFSLHVTPEVFAKYREELLSHASLETVDEQMEQSVPVYMPQSVTMPVVAASAAMQTEAVGSSHPKMYPHITPSPPAEAGRQEDHTGLVQTDFVSTMIQPSYAGDFMAHEARFVPAQRANSMPVQKVVAPPPATYFRQPPAPIGAAGCARNSFSAPAMLSRPIPFPTQEQFLVLETHHYLHPIEGGLIHHQFGHGQQLPSEYVDGMGVRT